MMNETTLRTAIAGYQQQYTEMKTALDQLEQSYQHQKMLASKTLDMCVGAIQALEQLIQNEQEAAKPAIPTDEIVTQG